MGKIGMQDGNEMLYIYISFYVSKLIARQYLP